MDSVSNLLKLTVCILRLGFAFLADVASDHVRDPTAVMKSDSRLQKVRGVAMGEMYPFETTVLFLLRWLTRFLPTGGRRGGGILQGLVG